MIILRRTSLLSVISMFCITFITCSLSSAIRAQQTPAASPAASRERGRKLYEEGDAKGAVEALREAVKQNKDDADAWYYLGLALSLETKLKDARQAFEKAVMLRPDFALARAAYAYALMLEGRWPEAEVEAERTLRIDTGNAEAHYVMGEARFAQLKPRSAFGEASSALKSKPDFALALLLKAKSLRSLIVDEFPSATKEQLDQLIALSQETVADIETFLKRNPNYAKAEALQQHLTALRPYADGNFENFVYKPNAVTSKASILSKPSPPGSGIYGVVTLQAIFRANGEVSNIVVVSTSDDRLTKSCIEAARKIKFIPAMKDGRAVSQYIRIEYHFI